MEILALSATELAAKIKAKEVTVKEAVEAVKALQRGQSAYDHAMGVLYPDAPAAAPGDTVLLSPACSSFDFFKNFAERGDLFRKIVLELE